MFFEKPITATIPLRYSCRTYLNKPLNPEIRRRLSYFAATELASPFGSQTRFRLVAATEDDSKTLRGLGTYGFIKDAAGFVIGATDNGGKSLEDFGYRMEKIILYATDLGLGTCWLGGTFTKSSFALRISLMKDEIIPAVASVGYIAPKIRYMDAKIAIDLQETGLLIRWGGNGFIDQKSPAPRCNPKAGRQVHRGR